MRPEVPPPGGGFVTVTGISPGLPLRALDGTVADNCVLLTNVVVTADPFHVTVEPWTKFEPTTVSVRLNAPIDTVSGDTDTTAGMGLFAGGGVFELFEPPHDSKSRQSTRPNRQPNNRFPRIDSLNGLCVTNDATRFRHKE